MTRRRDRRRSKGFWASLVTIVFVLAWVVGAVVDFGSLPNLWCSYDGWGCENSGSEGSNGEPGRPYLGARLKDYVPESSDFACAVTSSDNLEEQCAEVIRQEEIQENLKKSGAVKVVEVFPDGPAAKAGVRNDDIITGIEGIDVSGQVELERVLEERRPGDYVRLTLYRPDNVHFLHRESVRVKLE